MISVCLWFLNYAIVYRFTIIIITVFKRPSLESRAFHVVSTE